MKTIIAGSRGMKMADVDKAMAACPWTDDISEVVSGCAMGADRCGEIWAYQRDMPVKLFPAEWDKYGKRAGMLRNVKMAEFAQALVSVWDGQSRGTAHMISEAKRNGLRVFVWTPESAA